MKHHRTKKMTAASNDSVPPDGQSAQMSDSTGALPSLMMSEYQTLCMQNYIAYHRVALARLGAYFREPSREAYLHLSGASDGVRTLISNPQSHHHDSFHLIL